MKVFEKLEEAGRRSQVARRQFGKFRDVCNAVQQVTVFCSSVDSSIDLKLHTRAVKLICLQFT